MRKVMLHMLSKDASGALLASPFSFTRLVRCLLSGAMLDQVDRKNHFNRTPKQESVVSCVP